MTRDAVRLRRRGGRWVKDAPRTSAAAVAVPPVPEHLRGARRTGGRWVAPGADLAGRGSTWRHVSRRTWLLVMPVAGILAASSYQVRPLIADIGNARTRDATQLLDRKDELRARADAWQNEIQATTAELDTLHAPMIAFHQALHDSLLQMRAEQAQPITYGQLDSLRALRDRLAAEAWEARTEYWNRASVLSNLEAMQGALRDSIDRIERLALAMPSRVPEARKRGMTLGSVATYVGYVVAPVLGFMWAHSS
jgi:hypothetical protein